MALRYSKHHGLGNDFLVLLTDSLPLDAVDQAVALCDRRTGIGADGLIYGIAGESHDVSMKLFNSDGSTAAVSGNGLRCLAQAVARQRSVSAVEIDVATPAGIRHCSVRATDHPHARRQQRWFRRDPRIHWIDAPVTAPEMIKLWDEQRILTTG